MFQFYVHVDSAIRFLCRSYAVILISWQEYWLWSLSTSHNHIPFEYCVADYWEPVLHATFITANQLHTPGFLSPAELLICFGVSQRDMYTNNTSTKHLHWNWELSSCQFCHHWWHPCFGQCKYDWALGSGMWISLEELMLLLETRNVIECNFLEQNIFIQNLLYILWCYKDKPVFVWSLFWCQTGTASTSDVKMYLNEILFKCLSNESITSYQVMAWCY